MSPSRGSVDNRPRGGSGLGQIPEDNKIVHFQIGVHNQGNAQAPKARRHSYSLQAHDFASDEEHRRYIARKRWRKVKLFMKAMYKFSRRETYHHVDSSGSVFWKIKLLYAMPQFSLISLTMLINIQVIVFYNEIGVSLAFLSFFQIFARSFDVLTDPMMAHISDNLTRTKWGRRIPWMSIGAPFYAIAFFNCVNWSSVYSGNSNCTHLILSLITAQCNEVLPCASCATNMSLDMHLLSFTKYSNNNDAVSTFTDLLSPHKTWITVP
eukprot:71658_1